MPGIEDLMEALSSNKELADKLTAASNPDEATEIAKAAGYTITSQELLEAYKTKMAFMSSDELSNVAGGKGSDQGHNGGTKQSSDQGTILRADQGDGGAM